MILYSSWYQKYFRVVWCGLTVVRLQDNSGNNKIMSMPEYLQLVNENKKATVSAAAQ